MTALDLGSVQQDRSRAVQPSCACTHCGLSVPSGLIDAARSEQFCCHGCETAYEVIHRCGLDRYYAMLESAREHAPRVRETSRSYAEYDDAAFRSLHVRGAGSSVCSTEFFLSGVHCSACVWLVEKIPKLVPGVIEVRLDLARAIVRVVWQDDRVALSKIASVLATLGYPPHPARDARTRNLRTQEDRAQLTRLAVAGACAGNVMLLALAMYAGLLDEIHGPYEPFFRWASMVITLISLCWPGQVFFRSAYGALWGRTLNLDVPISLALVAGGLWSTIATIRGTGEVYFDTVSVLIFALLVGRLIQSRQQRWAADSVELLFSLTPTSARRVERDEYGTERIVEIAAESLEVGRIVEVRAGDSIPADGVVVQGASQIDQSLLTGESRPVAVAVGASLSAGTVNVASTVRLRVVATGEGTRVARLMSLVSEASRRRAPIVRLADRASSWFLGGMIVLSLVTFVAWRFIDPSAALEYAIAVLVVTCPCALGLATPLAMSVGLGRAARMGLLVKGGDAVQRLAARGGIIFLDKTGTITFGQMRVVRWAGDESVHPLVAAIERDSSHPIARGLLESLGESDLIASEVSQTTGGGIEGLVAGRRVVVGSPSYVRERCRLRDQPGRVDHALLAGWEREAADGGLTPVAIAVDGVVVAMAGLGDELRPDAAAAIARIKAIGWRVGMLSGDHEDVVAGVAAVAGIDAELTFGGLSPEAKVAKVREHGALGPVLMVGDGVNDAAALAAASVGVAMHGGAEASLAAADVYVSRPDLLALVELIEGSRRTMRVVKRGLATSTTYNVVAGCLAVMGLITPIGAAILMPISSLTVLMLSFRSRSFGSRSPRRVANQVVAS
jgi:Cu2+-exporting ATPase